MAINRFDVSGNLGNDPVFKTSKTTSSQYVEFSLAHKDGEETTWYNCKVFGKSANAAVDRLKKGDTVLVSGKLKSKIYDSIPNGIPRINHTIMANSWEWMRSPVSKSETTTTAPDGLPTPTSDTVEFDLPF